MSGVDRYTCTKDAPWTEEKGQYAEHPDADLIGECSEGCCDKYRCPHCGTIFYVELPE